MNIELHESVNIILTLGIFNAENYININDSLNANLGHMHEVINPILPWTRCTHKKKKVNLNADN
jgi:hypothetical protein